MKDKKIGVWGQFGDGGKIADGQAVRTTIITEEIKTRFGNDNVLIVNTNNWKKHPISFLLKTIKMNASCEKVVIFPADNGFKIVVPILDLFNRIFKSELYNVVIGGYLPDLLKRKPMYIGMLKRYKALFVQTARIQDDLEHVGLDNIHILSNLKRLNTLEEQQLEKNTSPIVKLCMVSRITNAKGIGYAVEAVNKVNETLSGNYVFLDIFGIIAENYKKDFEKILDVNKRSVSYGGVLDYNKTTETLKDYFLMLLPTFYYGEGFPGCVVDAYNAGLPIIATDWNYNKDVIQNEKNGFLVPIKNSDEICSAILKLYNNRDWAYNIACNNLKEAEQYKPDNVLKKFFELMDN